MVCKEGYFTKYCPLLVEFHQYLEGGAYPYQPMVLTNTFARQQQQMVEKSPTAPPGGNARPASANIMMVKSMVESSPREKNYESMEW